jgi:asparagine synthase (glutamine-hydrolysing)
MWVEKIKRLPQPWSTVGCAVLHGGASFNKKVAKYSPAFDRSLEQYYLSRTSGPDSLFNCLSESDVSEDIAAEIKKAPSFTASLFRNVRLDSPLNKMLYVDSKTWLPDDLLIKADKITMANSVELRVPLLDHKVLEFAAKLPGNYKVHGLNTKYILKRALQHRVPSKILNRKKSGFPVPYNTWMANELRPFIHDVLTDSRTLQRGYFQRRFIDKLLSDHVERGQYGPEVFSLLTLELWHRVFIDRSSQN